ncbi:hypothetical protein IKF94_00845 [Candidatus Saccharibacteria bacterium]|nr:hypothetical protein [Candidatus Saccharibacteria bacterium]
MDLVNQTEQLCHGGQIAKDILLPIATAIVGSVATGFATFKGVTWKAKREEKRTLILEISNSILDLQTTAISNFSPMTSLDDEKRISEVSSSYAVNFKKVKGLSVFLPKQLQKQIEKYFGLTHHNIVVWIGKIRKDPIYTSTMLDPFSSQASEDGEAKRAYDKATEALANFSIE